MPRRDKVVKGSVELEAFSKKLVSQKMRATERLESYTEAVELFIDRVLLIHGESLIKARQGTISETVEDLVRESTLTFGELMEIGYMVWECGENV